jgi:OOP family OmpA-OmpF porin
LAVLLGAPANASGPEEEGPAEASVEGEGEGSVSLGGGAASGSAETDEEDGPKPWNKRHVGTPQLEIGVFGGGFFADVQHDFYDADVTTKFERPPLWAMGGDIGLRVAGFPKQGIFGIEAEFANVFTAARNLSDDFVYLYSLRGHGILQLPNSRVTPFLLGGYGLLGVSTPDTVLGKDVDPAGHYGVGVKLFVNKLIALRVDARHVISAKAAEQQSTGHHFEALAGLSITLAHRKPKPKPKPDPDRDKDGFLNEVDACPDTSGVEPKGCPPTDKDGDGFWDHQDQCPEVPGVDPDGCPPPDTDGDGFIDPEDDCPEDPETKNGYKDKDGCPDEVPEEVKEFTGVIAGIEFETDKDEIRDVSKAVLDKALGILKEYETIRLEISGHTDDTGTREHNLDLSKRRAEAVKKFFVDGGVDESRLTTRGAGPDEPIGDNGTEEGRAQNRRTEFKIITQ